MDKNALSGEMQGYCTKYIELVQKVITNPAGFYREMAKTGGLVDPLIFMIVMGVVGGLLQAILGIVGLGAVGSFLVALASIVIVPIGVVIFGFIGGAILYMIWKFMGSQEPFEVAFRCLAYAAAITPITTVLNVIPYVGPLFGLVWMTYLLVIASTEVHQVEAQRAWIVFGALCALFALISISSQIAARKVTSNLESLQNKMEQMDKMKPEEAGKMLGEFLKGVEKGKQ